MHQLTCSTRSYAWGSRTLLPRFLRQDRSEEPQAELWIGAHPGDPARLPDGRTLTDLIAEHPENALGTSTFRRFGPRLPFLMKALAAAEPLSLQVHPTSERAREGFARENAAGIAVGAPNRSYQDDSHKPELILALTRFEGMAGFRDVEKSAEILRLLDLPWADRVAEQLGEAPAAAALHAVVAEMLATDGDDLAALLVDLGKAARRSEERAHGRRRPSTRHYDERTSVAREAPRMFALAASLAERYPADPGVLVTLLLNHVILSPGEAMFLDAGVVHAYTSGFGVEIMASSDNVVRAGLTPKHVDVPELLDIADFTPIPPPVWDPTALDDGSALFAPPVDEFSLYVGHAPMRELPDRGPRIVLALEGEVEVVSGADRTVLAQGSSVFVPDAEGPLAVEGVGRVAVGAVPA